MEHRIEQASKGRTEIPSFYTVKDLLLTGTVRGNLSKLALLLKVNRGTLRKYMDDTDNHRHFIWYIEGKYIFMNTPQNKKERF